MNLRFKLKLVPKNAEKVKFKNFLAKNKAFLKVLIGCAEKA